LILASIAGAVCARRLDARAFGCGRTKEIFTKENTDE
jgi:hypothetical protein